MSSLEYKLGPDATAPFKNWENVNDVGVDVAYAGETLELRPKLRYVLDTQVSIIPPPGTFAMMVPRSSLSKKQIIILNSVGIIDPSYRGTLKAAVTYVGHESVGCQIIEKGERIAQLIFLPYVNITNLVPTSLSDKEWETSTNRGTGGFGSTGKI